MYIYTFGFILYGQFIQLQEKRQDIVIENKVFSKQK